MITRHIPIDSKNLKAVGYDPDTYLLEVTFHNDTVYQYHNVPPATYAKLMNAESVGNYFNTVLRGWKQQNKKEPAP